MNIAERTGKRVIYNVRIDFHVWTFIKTNTGGGCGHGHGHGHRPSFCAIDRVLGDRPSFVPWTEICVWTEFCAIDRDLRDRPSFVWSTEFLSHGRVLCHRSSFVPSTEICVIDRVLCDRPSFCPMAEFCVIDRVLCHRPSFVSVLTHERQYLWRVKSFSQIKCSHERYFIFGLFGAP